MGTYRIHNNILIYTIGIYDRYVRVSDLVNTMCSWQQNYLQFT